MMTEQEKNQARRQMLAIWNSPQGRDLGRWLLRERGKDKGDIGKMLRSLTDLFAEVARDLYSSPPPTQSR